MTEYLTSRIKGTAARGKVHTPRPSSPPTPGIGSEVPPGPGDVLLHNALGPLGYRRLSQHRRHQHSARGALAGGGIQADRRQVHPVALGGFGDQALRQGLEDTGVPPLPEAVVHAGPGAERGRHLPPQRS